MTKSPLRYPGGKSRAIETINELISIGEDRLCSPFLGGGSVELFCASERNIQVNGKDVYEPLVVFWNELLTNPKELVDIIKKYLIILDKTLFKIL